MAVVLTYDIDRLHTAVKETLLSYGYQDSVPAVNTNNQRGIIKLPNTTLFHENRTIKNAYLDMQKVAIQYGVLLERCIAFELMIPVDYWGSFTAI